MVKVWKKMSKYTQNVSSLVASIFYQMVTAYFFLLTLKRASEATDGNIWVAEARVSVCVSVCVYVCVTKKYTVNQ